MDTQKEIGKLKGQIAELKGGIAALKLQVAAIEAQLGKAAQVAASPGGSLEIDAPCGHKYTVGSMAVPGSDAEAAAKAKLEARDCPDCETKKKQAENKARGKAEFEGRPVDDMAVVTRR